MAPLTKRLLIFCFWIYLYNYPGISQQASLITDIRSGGMGSPLAVLSGHWSVLTNPAGLATINSTSFGLFYCNFYGISELGSGAFAISIPTKSGNFGIGFLSAGFKSLTENRTSISYGKSIGKNLQAGIRIDWLLFNQPSDYRDLYAWIPSAGIQWHPFNKLIVAATIVNPARQEYIPAGYMQIPSGVISGLGFQLSDEILMLLEVRKFTDEPFNYVLGLEATVKKPFLMRFGITRQDYFSYSLGAGYSFRKLTVDMAMSHHPVLGFSPGLGLTFSK